MKGQAFHKRLGHAWRGIVQTALDERSFRTQLAAGCVASLIVGWLSPPLIWAALVVVMVVLVLAAELLNTALERVLDGLHPSQAEFVRMAKDCAAGAVLVCSIGAVLVFVLMLVDVLNQNPLF